MPGIQAVQNYAIFFDDVRVDDLVKNWNVNLSCNGSMGVASIEMLHFQQIAEEAEKSGIPGLSNDIKDMLNVIDNMTNVKIFVQNIFSDKYQLVFDGNIRGTNKSKSASSGNGLSFQAVDYMNYTNRAIAPIVIPYNIATHPSDKFIWEAQGIDVSKVLTITQRDMLNFKGKSVKEILSLVVTQALSANKIFSDRAGVGYWDGVWDRMDLMADINKDILEKGVADYIIEPEASNIDTMYVLLNQIFQKLIFEFYQDRDGIIRIKPPFWSQPVLKSHIIDPSLIISISENTNYENYLTRVIITGGLDENFQTGNQLSDYLWTPIGCYLSNGTWVTAQPYEGYKYGWGVSPQQTDETPDDSDSDNNFEGNTIAEQMWNFYIDKGFSKQAVAAMLGNVQAESNFNPATVNGIGAGGLCQWYMGRLTALKQYAKSKGKDWTDAETQILYMYKELEEGTVTTWSLAKTTYSAFKKSTDVELATAQFQWAFERAEYPDNTYPGIYGDKIGWYMEKRIAAAKRIYKLYATGATSTSAVRAMVNFTGEEPASTFDTVLNIAGYHYKKIDGTPIVGEGTPPNGSTSIKGVGAWFPSVENGVKAHVQQLSSYYRHSIIQDETPLTPAFNESSILYHTVLSLSKLPNKNNNYGKKMLNLILDLLDYNKKYALEEDIPIGASTVEQYKERVTAFHIEQLKIILSSRMQGRSYNINNGTNFSSLFDIYITECEKELIYPEVALAHMIVETGWLCWGGKQSHFQNNFGGLCVGSGKIYTKSTDWYW